MLKISHYYLLHVYLLIRLWLPQKESMHHLYLIPPHSNRKTEIHHQWEHPLAVNIPSNNIRKLPIRSPSSSPIPVDFEGAPQQ